MEFEFVENFYDTIKSRARAAAVRQKPIGLESDENKKKRKTIRRNNLKNKAKSSLKTKGKVRKRKSKSSDLSSPTLKKRNSNKKTPTPSPKKKLPTSNNDIDEEEAAYILSTISQRSFETFYNRFPTTVDNKIEIPIIGYESVDNFTRISSDQPYSHILLDHNYWSCSNQPEITFQIKATEVVKVEETLTQNDEKIEVKVEPEVEAEVNNNLAESAIVVKCSENDGIEEVKKKTKCRKILSKRKVKVGKKKLRAKEKKSATTICNGVSTEKITENGEQEHHENQVKQEPSPSIENHCDEISTETDKKDEIIPKDEVENLKKEETNQNQNSSVENIIVKEEVDDNLEDDEQSWNLISDFHGTILEKLTSNNVRYFGDTSESSSTSTSISVVGSVNNYYTSSDSRTYTPNDSYRERDRDSFNRRQPYNNYRVHDPRYKYENNYRRRDNFHRHHSYSEGISTYASYKAQKTMVEQRHTFNNNDSGNHQRQPVSVFELPVNGSIVKDLLPILEKKEFVRSKSIADPRLASSSSFETEKSPNPKKKVRIHCFHRKLDLRS